MVLFKAPDRKKKVQQIDPLYPWKHLVVYLGLSGA